MATVTLSNVEIVTTPTQTIYVGLGDLLLTSYCLRRQVDLVAASTAIVNFMAPNYFADAATIVGYGMPAWAPVWAYFGITQMDAVQNMCALISIAGLPAANGETWPNRGNYLYFLARAWAIILDPNNKALLLSYSLDFSVLRSLPAVDRFVACAKLLQDLRINAPQFWLYFDPSASLRHMLDNLVLFDQIRCQSQGTIPAPIPPNPKTSVYASGAGNIGDMMLDGFGA